MASSCDASQLWWGLRSGSAMPIAHLLCQTWFLLTAKYKPSMGNLGCGHATHSLKSHICPTAHTLRSRKLSPAYWSCGCSYPLKDRYRKSNQQLHQPATSNQQTHHQQGASKSAKLTVRSSEPNFSRTYPDPWSWCTWSAKWSWWIAMYSPEKVVPNDQPSWPGSNLMWAYCIMFSTCTCGISPKNENPQTTKNVGHFRMNTIWSYSLCREFASCLARDMDAGNKVQTQAWAGASACYTLKLNSCPLPWRRFPASCWGHAKQ